LITTAARLTPAPRKAERGRAGVELGHEPPIEIDGPRRDSREGRRIPWRWMLGVALTGLSGAALIGSALYLALDRQSNFAEAPEFASAPRRDAPEAQGVNPGKGDRLVRPVDIVAAKQTFRSPMTIKIGDKEVLKARPFTLLSTSLTTTPTGFAEQVPAFDPLKLTSGAAEKGEAPLESAPMADDSEAAYTSRDLGPGDAAGVRTDLSLDEVRAQINEAVKAATAGDAITALAPQMLLMRTSRAGVDPLGALPYATTGSVEANTPFASIEVRMVPENVTNASRDPSDPSARFVRRRLSQLRHGETFEDVLRANGASRDAIPAILAAFGLRRGESPVAEGQRIIFEYQEPGSPEAAPQIARISVYADEQLKAAVAINDAGAYIPVTNQSPPAPPTAPKTSDEADEGGMSLYESLYETGLKQGLPKPIVDELVRAFANDVDFQRSVQPGDSMVAFLSEPDEFEPHPVLLFASMTVRDQTYRYYRFQTPDDNVVDYYDENGRSTRKFLLRKPIADGEITSGFGMRYHPILHYARMHSGVDWGAPVGTPIFAAGNGTVLKAEFTSGYGRRVEIQHANGYVTTYNHMSGFGRGITAGVHVNQGQVVGYLGQSGLATGPHLHYEVVINGNFVDPMAIKLPRTREFDGKMLAQFKHERDRIDQVMAQAPNAGAAAPGPTARLN